MKVALKILSLCLSATTIITTFAACSSKIDLNAETNESNYNTDNIATDSNASSNNDNESSEKNTEQLPSNIYLLFQNGKYTFKAVMPDNPTDTEKAVYSKLRSSIKSKTGTTLESATDYLKEGEKHPSSEYAILIGLTNYNESQNVYGNTENGTYGVKFFGKKIAFYFSTREEGTELVNAFCDAIKSNSDNAFWISKSFSISKENPFKLEDVPNYPTTTTSYNCEDDTTMLLAKSTNLTTFKNYCNTLKSAGYTEYSKRDNVNGNYFYTFTKGTMALTVYFIASTKTVRIISSPLSDIPSKDIDRTAESNKNPSVTLLTQGAEKGSGLGMIYHLPNGKFIVYDGGYVLNDALYTKLKELAKGTDIIIAAWIISHPHPDHEDAFDSFLEKHANEVRIENVMYNFTKCSDKYGNSETIKPIIEKYINRKTNVIKPHTGQIYNFGSSTVEILHTVEDFIPSKISDVNYTTMIVRITVSGQTTMLLGDACDDVPKFLTSAFGTYLKSDMVQLAHHGTYPGTETLYSNINAPILFWPSCASNVKARYNSNGHESLRKAISIAKDVYLAGDGTTTVSIPCKIVNNKSAFMKRMGL